MSNKTRLFTSIISLCIAGCTLTPEYHRPKLPVSEAWPSGEAYNFDKRASNSGISITRGDLGWREFFSEPRLQKIIELALQNNRDLRIATLNVEQARSLHRVQRAALMPEVDLTTAATRQRGTFSAAGTGAAAKTTTTLYRAEVGTAYELDLFGRVRSLNEAAVEEFFAAEDRQRAAHIALVAEIATQYLLERALDEQLSLSEKTLSLVDSSHDLNKRSFELGHVSELDLRASEAQVQIARSNIARYQEQLAQATNLLTLLAGSPLPSGLPPATPLHEQELPANLPEGLPSELLHRRPDILAAEHSLRAANADIGAARAAFFPTIQLTGAAGVASPSLSDLFSGSSEVWSFAPRITLPIFSGWRNRANLDLAKVRERIEVARYEATIQAAFREVADALASRGTIEERIKAQEALVSAQDRRFTLASARYKSGVDSYLSVITAQQDLFGAQQALIQSRFDRLSNLISFYSSLGGGWDETSANSR